MFCLVGREVGTAWTDAVISPRISGYNLTCPCIDTAKFIEMHVTRIRIRVFILRYGIRFIQAVSILL